MGARKSDGPLERGDAPAGPEMLSAVDGASITSTSGNAQLHMPAGAACASLILLVAPVPTLPGFFTVRLAGDNRLLARSRTPFFAAARALLAADFNPATRLSMLHTGSAIVCLSATIATAARLTVEESTHGPVLRSFRMVPQSAVGAARMRLRERGARDAHP